MQEILDLRDGRSFPLAAGLPPGYGGIILKGALVSSGQTGSGLVVLQNFQRTGFAVRLGIYKFIHLVHCFLKPLTYPTASTISLRNDLKSRIPGIGSFTLKEKEFSILQYGAEPMLADFKAGKEYQLLDICYSPEMLAQILPHFPNLETKFQQAADQPSACLISSQRPVGNETMRIVQDLLHSPFDPEMNEAYFEDKVRECVWLLMIESSRKKVPRVMLGEADRNRLEELGQRMRHHPRDKFPISQVSRDMGMNEMTFKTAFKQEYGKGIFEYHLDQRMKEAEQLLKNSDLPIKMIAGLVGYELTTSFITKFIEYFGYPPSRIQKK
jgi:AraC-like DNA-binding protein